MGDHRSYVFIVFFHVLLSCFTFSSNGFQFNVGGKNGWSLNPSESYDSWAQRLRFQVNDTLLFKYKKGSDSVLVVGKDDYGQCNTANPKAKLDDGDSVFRFDRSGPFFFISGNKSSCTQGEKLIVVVLAVRSSRPSSPPQPGAPSPAAAPSRWAPQSPPPQGEAPAPSGSVPSEAPAPGTASNSTTGGESPAGSLAAAACGPSALFVSAVSVVVNVCLGGFIISI